MGSTSTIDFSADRLIAIAAEGVEEHNYIKALKMLNKNAVLNGNDEDAFMLYAEIFDDLGLYEKSINGWFKYLDYAGDGADFAEAYEGLAVNYMNMGKQDFAAYYYNKLLIETDKTLTPQNRQALIETFILKEQSPLAFAWPPEIADYSEELDRGVELLRHNDFDGAIAEFEKVKKGNEKFNLARNYIAMCNVISDRNEEAEAECLKILESNPNDVAALTAVAAVKRQQGKSEEAVAYARRLLTIKTDNDEELYKIATVCCENGMHEEAYCVFERMDERYSYDCSYLFFKAVAAYNCDKIEKSIELFDRLLTVYPNAVTADYWYSIVLRESKKPFRRRFKLGYFYRLPKVETETNVAMLTALNSLSEVRAKKLADEVEASAVLHWCFDEGDTDVHDELRLVGALAALKIGLDDTVRDILLDAFVSEPIKLELLAQRVQQNTEGEYGIVVCNVFKKIVLRPVEIGTKKRKLFLRAYGLAFSRFGILEFPLNAARLSKTTEAAYAGLDKNGRLDVCKNEAELAAAIVLCAKANGDIPKENVCGVFGAKVSKVEKLMGEINENL